MKLLALLLTAVAAQADDGFAKWYQRFQNAVAKGNAEAATELAEFPMDWEYGATRKIPARAVLVGRFDFYFTADIKQAVATKKPERISNGQYIITWKARGNEYSMYFKRLDAEAFAILSDLRDGKRLSEAVERVDWRETSDEQAAERIQAWFALWSSLGWFCKST